jgi:integrase
MKPSKLCIVEDRKTDCNIQSQNHNKRNRVKEYLTDHEVLQLIEAAKSTRYPLRDQLLILLAWRHGLRYSELVGLKLNQVNIPAREIYVKRVKGSENTHHPLAEDEVRLLKRYLKLGFGQLCCE